MSSIVKHLPPYLELKKEIESNPENLNFYGKYSSFIGEEKAVEYLIDKLLEDDKKSNTSSLQKFIKSLTKKYIK
jgi:hypothetical protein